jgi:hypothetical protein
MARVARTYWLDLFTVETWQEFLSHGGDVSGFRESRWAIVQKIKPGDYLLCYLTGASRWVGLLEVAGEPYFDQEPIWSSQTYPSRLRVRVEVALSPEQGVPVLEMRDQLTVFRDLANPNLWSGPFRGSPRKWKAVDGEAISRALHEAKASPVERPLGPRVRRISKTVLPHRAADEAVVVPGEDETAAAEESATATSAHTEMQYLLAKLGSDMGFDVHVARNDQNRIWDGHRLGGMPRRREQLPQQFDPVTNRTIELIDLLWLDGNAIVAAFEIESTTSIYSGLLRMSDLVARQPNISVPLFLVAPEEKREQVVRQVNRPTFERMKPPLVEVCRYISFEGLREALTAAHNYVSFLKSDWLQDISESCAIEDI